MSWPGNRELADFLAQDEHGHRLRLAFCRRGSGKVARSHRRAAGGVSTCSDFAGCFGRDAPAAAVAAESGGRDLRAVHRRHRCACARQISCAGATAESGFSNPETLANVVRTTVWAFRDRPSRSISLESQRT